MFPWKIVNYIDSAPNFYSPPILCTRIGLQPVHSFGGTDARVRLGVGDLISSRIRGQDPRSNREVPRGPAKFEVKPRVMSHADAACRFDYGDGALN
ncbi:hypothetical protein SSBR45G_18640 [Bradyrhizobium sp. SSBR45G]|nr:hypothetical protein SSBR45G_18640 [Bradyrhizobium sp. SSBR45G]GLH83714.1 hypothetical protein SSBR45R_11740 [Bradyrhizobium sp. SSBR45R]